MFLLRFFFLLVLSINSAFGLYSVYRPETHRIALYSSKNNILVERQIQSRKQLGSMTFTLDGRYFVVNLLDHQSVENNLFIFDAGDFISAVTDNIFVEQKARVVRKISYGHVLFVLPQNNEYIGLAVWDAIERKSWLTLFHFEIFSGQDSLSYESISIPFLPDHQITALIGTPDSKKIIASLWNDRKKEASFALIDVATVVNNKPIIIPVGSDPITALALVSNASRLMLGFWSEEDQKSYVSMFDADTVTQFPFDLSTLEIASEKIMNFSSDFSSSTNRYFCCYLEGSPYPKIIKYSQGCLVTI